jgi:formiminoglutamase
LEASQNIGIINFDAHFDLRKNVSEGHSGSPFYQIAADCAKDGTPFKYCCLGIRPEDNPRELFDTARELNVKYMTLAEFSISNLPVITSFIGTFLADVDKVYVTLDMDGFSSAYAPGVSAASPSGFMPELIKNSISQITRSGKLLGIDVAETNPTFDRDAQTAKLAAIMLHFVMHELALF